MKKHPGWKNAVEVIVNRVESEGYGITITHSELLEYFDIERPKDQSFDEYQKFQLTLLKFTDQTKEELIEDHNLCLNSVRGEGYQVLHPNDQVSIMPGKLIKKARRHIALLQRVLTNVNSELLSIDKDKERLCHMQKAAFIKQAINRRKFEIVGDNMKQITVSQK